MNKATFNAILALLVVFIIANNIVHAPNNILSWDVFGYYLYLPFTFIYDDLGLKNDSVVHAIIAKYNSTATFYQATKMPEGHYVMKYSMGMAIFFAPFFFLGHLAAGIFGYEQDGFSAPYQYSFFFGAIVYAVIAIIVLAKVLRYYFTETVSAIVLGCIVLGTNYIVHITMYGQNGMSHNYLFFAYSLILYFTVRWHQTYKTKHLVLLAIICGLAILSRPTEIVCLIIPALWNVWNKDSFMAKLQLLWNRKVQLMLFAGIIIVLGSFQLVYWKIYAGKFIFNSYGANAGEGLDLFTPHFYNFLFSFRKGWLLYTPIMIAAIAGFYFAKKKNSPVFIPLLTFFLVNLYIIASWSNWWYTQSFSQRPMVSTYPVMAMLLGFTIAAILEKTGSVRWILGALLASIIFFNIFQTVQFHKGVLHGDRMTSKYYFAVFGKLYATENDKKLLLIERSFDGVEVFNDQESYKQTLKKHMEFDGVEIAGKKAKRLDTSSAFSPAIEVPYYDITEKDHAWIRITAWVYPTNLREITPFALVSQFTHNDYAYKYATHPRNDFPIKPNEWNKIQIDYLTPEVRSKEDFLKTYVWLAGKGELYIHSLDVEFYERKD